MRAELIPVSRDLYSVSERLKEIDERYEALQLTVPRGELDARVLARVRETRIERAEKVLDEIERACAAARRAAEKLALERAEEALEQEGSCW